MGNNETGIDTGPTGAIKVTKVQYLGRVCEKHPELKGLRYKKNGTCMGCTWAHTAERRRRIDEYPALVEEVKSLRALLDGCAVVETIDHYRDRAVALAFQVDSLSKELLERRGSQHRLQILGNAVLKIGRRVRAGGHDAGAYPGHDHIKPGFDGFTGRPCEACADWSRMLKLAKQK